MTKLEEKLIELGYKKVTSNVYHKGLIYIILFKSKYIIDKWVEIGQARTKDDIKMITDTDEYYFELLEIMYKDWEILVKCQD